MQKIPAFGGAALLCLALTTSNAQSTDSAVNKIANIPSRLLNHIQSKTATLNAGITRQSETYLGKLERWEQRLQQKLARIDPSSGTLFSSATQQYASLKTQLTNEQGSSSAVIHGPYLPNADSTRVMLGFLQQHPELLSSSGITQERLTALVVQFQLLQTKIKDADQVRQFIRQRKTQIAAYLGRLTNIPSSITNAYQGYGRSLFYYSQQLNQYKTMLNDPGQLQERALSALRRLPAFQSFMSRNSQLAMLFGGVPTGSPQAIAGLQTKQGIQQLIQSKVGNGGPKVEGSMANRLDVAGQGLALLQQRVAKYGDAGQDMDDPDFKPNDQKVLSFLKRLEYGVSVQTQPSTIFYPTTTNLALTLGYRLNDNNTIGIGAGALIGWGSDIRHINVTGSGFNVRSFADIHVSKTWYASGGFELNYQPPVTGLSQLPGLSNWQRSGLIGISKIVSVKSGVLKRTKLQLLWDFLSYYQTPQTAPIKFRVGYGF